MQMDRFHWEMLEAIGHFSRGEKNQEGKLSFPKPYQMDFEFMVKLEKVRQLKKSQIIIHNTFEKDGHAPNSIHDSIPTAVADGHIKGLTLHDQASTLCKVFDRVGVYPWSWASKGWHIDDAVRLGVKKRKVFWIEDEKKTGKYNYFTSKKDFLYELGKIPSAVKVF